jgi:hypothetical protein
VLVSNLTDAETARFKSKTERRGDCLVWLGPLDRDGYGTFYFRRKNRRAHRVAWYALGGPIPEGHVINHICRNRACVNPQHLDLVTVRDNALRDSTNRAYVNSRKTACPRGHPFDRTVVYKERTQRVCSICEREKHRRLRAKWRAEDTLRV